VSYIPKAEQRRRRAQAKEKGMGGSSRDRSGFWSGVLFGAASATGGYFAIKALEKAFGRKREEEATKNALLNPGAAPALNAGSAEEARQRLISAATGGGLATPADKPPVAKRTIIEEMVEELG
jgi:hypothetical protein